MKEKKRKDNQRKHNLHSQKEREDDRKPLINEAQRERHRADAAEAPSICKRISIIWRCKSPSGTGLTVDNELGWDAGVCRDG